MKPIIQGSADADWKEPERSLAACAACWKRDEDAAGLVWFLRALDQLESAAGSKNGVWTDEAGAWSAALEALLRHVLRRDVIAIVDAVELELLPLVRGKCGKEAGE